MQLSSMKRQTDEDMRSVPERSAAAFALGAALATGLAGALTACGSHDARVIEAGSPEDPWAERARGSPGGGATGLPPEGGSGGASVSMAPEAGGAAGVSAGPGGPSRPGTDEFTWELPPGFPEPVVPADNPMTRSKIELGRHLFYDERLSRNETMACATCHRQELAFTDGRAVALGSTGQSHSRGAMSLANVAYASTLTWSHPYMIELERQAAVPLFGEAPVELGFRSEAELEERLLSIPEYVDLFAAAFPGEPAPVSALNVGRALAAFQRTLISGRSPFDRWAYDGDESALSASAQRGFELFFSERLECFHCHLGFNFSDQVTYTGRAFPEALFHNTGLYNVDGSGAYPEPNTGVFEVTRDPADMGKFKAPTLRNIAMTAPYMHDGSAATLSEVLDHYASGGRTIDGGPNAGAGSASPLASELIRGFELSAEERADVLAFLEALTDDDFLSNPAFSSPWPR